MNKAERMELIQELNDLSEFEEQNKERMREIASILVDEYYHPDIQEAEPEKQKKRICKEWLQIESCRECLFDTLCQLKKFNSN